MYFLNSSSLKILFFSTIITLSFVLLYFSEFPVSISAFSLTFLFPIFIISSHIKSFFVIFDLLYLKAKKVIIKPMLPEIIAFFINDCWDIFLVMFSGLFSNFTIVNAFEYISAIAIPAVANDIR